MTNFKIIESRSKKILKYQDHIFKFNNNVNTRGKGTLWSCANEKCKAFVKVNSDNTKIIEANEKHEHTMSINTGKTNSSAHIASPRTSTSSSEADTEDIISPKIKTTKQDRNVVTQHTYTNLLPCDQSILSMGTPACANITQDNSTFNEITPHRPVNTIEDLRNQIRCLAQVIINKQIEIDELIKKSKKVDQELINKQNEIDRLMEKSKGDEKDMKDMIETIKVLEEANTCDKQTHSPGKPSRHTRRRLNRKQRKSIESINQTLETHNQTPDMSEYEVNIAAPVTQRNCVVIGDSQTRNLRNLLDKHSDQYNFKSYVSPGGNFTKVGVKCWKTDLENRDENTARNHLVIMAGTIDGFYDLDWKEIKQGFNKLKEISQNTYVTIILVPYNLKNKHISCNIYELNNAIYKYFKHVSNVEIVDTNAILNRPMFYRYDKYHLNDVGKNVLAHRILKSLYRLDTRLKRDPVGNFY
uniref:FLYWCH-type domain-containing protein n=1 Tax=Cacopsylla melanoneura TaxID=428564 RepID=A0A8D9E6D5_9HEMI